jgi:hypothetical protein
MAQKFGGSAFEMRAATVQHLSRILKVQPSRWTRLEQASFEKFALVLALVPDLPRWSEAETQTLTELIRVKADSSEMKYLHLTQQHGRLREALLKLGS